MFTVLGCNNLLQTQERSFDDKNDAFAFFHQAVAWGQENNYRFVRTSTDSDEFVESLGIKVEGIHNVCCPDSTPEHYLGTWNGRTNETFWHQECCLTNPHVPHNGSTRCKSGKRPHCTCDLCY